LNKQRDGYIKVSAFNFTGEGAFRYGNINDHNYRYNMKHREKYIAIHLKGRSGSGTQDKTKIRKICELAICKMNYMRNKRAQVHNNEFITLNRVNMQLTVNLSTQKCTKYKQESILNNVTIFDKILEQIENARTKAKISDC